MLFWLPPSTILLLKGKIKDPFVSQTLLALISALLVSLLFLD